MMRLCKLALVFGVVALMASPAFAQPGRGFGGGPRLLQNKSVQEELKLDKEQIDKVKDAFDKVDKDFADDIKKLRDRDTKPEERAEISKKVDEARTKGIKGVLNEKQEKRFHQILHQQQGVAMFQDEEVQKTLKLKDDQKKEIKTINDDLQKDVRELFQGGFSAETRKKMEGLRKEAMDKALKVLDKDQQKAAKELTGEPFEIKFEAKPGKP